MGNFSLTVEIFRHKSYLSGEMSFSNICLPRVSAMPSFNTKNGLETFRAPGRFRSIFGGTLDEESENKTQYTIRVEILKVKLPRSIISHACQETGSKTQSKG